MKKIQGYKGFNKDMTCQGFQYKEGETYEHKGELKICNSGFHFRENPLDCWSYYSLLDSIFHKVISLGKTDNCKTDTKIATTKIQIGAKISLSDMIKASVNFVISKTSKNTKTKTNDKSAAQIGSSGNAAQIGSSGNFAQIGSSGNVARIGSSGYAAQIELNGKHSVGMCAGYNSRMKGKKGNWITLAEWKYNEEEKTYIPVCVKTAQIDGKKLKADTWYKLENKKFVEVS